MDINYTIRSFLRQNYLLLVVNADEISKVCLHFRREINDPTPSSRDLELKKLAARTDANYSFHRHHVFKS